MDWNSESKQISLNTILLSHSREFNPFTSWIPGDLNWWSQCAAKAYTSYMEVNEVDLRFQIC